jgi:hypothetical protein
MLIRPGTNRRLRLSSDLHILGDRVWCNSLGMRGSQGPFSEFVPVEAERLFQFPGSIDTLQAVAVLQMATAAFTGLELCVGGVHPGQSRLVGRRGEMSARRSFRWWRRWERGRSAPRMEMTA